VHLNGVELVLGANDDLPALRGEPIGAGTIVLSPATVTFLTFEAAANSACR